MKQTGQDVVTINLVHIDFESPCIYFEYGLYNTEKKSITYFSHTNKN